MRLNKKTTLFGVFLAFLIAAICITFQSIPAYADDGEFDPYAITEHVDSLFANSNVNPLLSTIDRPLTLKEQMSNDSLGVIEDGTLYRSVDCLDSVPANRPNIPLASGTHDRYFDCINTSAWPWMKRFYDQLAEWTNFDGKNDLLIEDSTFATTGLAALNMNSSVGTIGSHSGSTYYVLNKFNLNGQNFDDSWQWLNRTYGATYYFFVDDEPTAIPLVHSRAPISCLHSASNDTILVLYKLTNLGTAYGKNSFAGDKARMTKAYNDSVSNANTILKTVEGKSDYEKVKYFHSWLASYNGYNHSLYEDVKNGTGDTRNIALANTFSASLCKEYGNPVCGGFSHGMVYLCRRAGIPCSFISMTAFDENGKEENYGHAWTSIKISGEWYNDDVTFEQNVEDTLKIDRGTTYTYCLQGSSSKNWNSSHEKYAFSSTIPIVPNITNLCPISPREQCTSTKTPVTNLDVQRIDTNATASKLAQYLSKTENVGQFVVSSGEIDKTKLNQVQYIVLSLAVPANAAEYSSMSQIKVGVKVLPTNSAKVAIDTEKKLVQENGYPQVTITQNGQAVSNFDVSNLPNVTVTLDNAQMQKNRYSLKYELGSDASSGKVTATSYTDAPYQFSASETFGSGNIVLNPSNPTVTPLCSQGLPLGQFYYGEKVTVTPPSGYSIKCFLRPSNNQNNEIEVTLDSSNSAYIPVTGKFYIRTVLTQGGATSTQIYPYEITVLPKPLTFKAQVEEKVADGKKDAAIKIVSVDGRAPMDTAKDVYITATGTFDDANPGTNKKVAANFALAGPKASMYSLETTSATTTGTIKAANGSSANTNNNNSGNNSGNNNNGNSSDSNANNNNNNNNAVGSQQEENKPSSSDNNSTQSGNNNDTSNQDSEWITTNNDNGGYLSDTASYETTATQSATDAGTNAPDSSKGGSLTQTGDAIWIAIIFILLSQIAAVTYMRITRRHE